MSSAVKKNRQREPNLLASERELLMNILEEHKQITDCRRTDGVSVERKKKEWDHICEEFNRISSLHYRDAAFLKQSWDNIKKRAKKDAAENKLRILKTGGGPLKKLIEDPATERVVNMFEATCSGFNNTYDGDSSFLISPLKSNAEILDPNGPDSLKNDENVFDDLDEVETSNDWSRYNPTMLRKPISRALKGGDTNGSSFSEVEKDEKLLEPIGEISNYSIEADKSSETPIEKITNYSTSKISRRRPSLPQKNVDFSVNEARKKSLLSSVDLAKEEHELNMQHKREEHCLKQQILQEKLAQEKIKTRLLEIELEEKYSTTSVEWLDENSTAVQS